MALLYIIEGVGATANSPQVLSIWVSAIDDLNGYRDAR
jgi:hypothetical protein